MSIAAPEEGITVKRPKDDEEDMIFFESEEDTMERQIREE